MAESIVRVPKNINADYDFIAFSFNGMHSYEDFGIYRTSDGDRYNVELGPQLNDRTAEITGADGMLFFGSNHKQKVFNINFAFECLTDEKIRQMKKWLDGKEVHDLWFAEEPYKVYSAKVTSIPSIKYVPFDDNTLGRVYRGEGTIQFTAYWPYAHTPDKIQYWHNNQWVDIGSGIVYNNYSLFSNYKSFENQLPGKNGNCGDLPFHFVADLIEPKYISTSVIRLNNEHVSGLSIEYNNAEVNTTNNITTITLKEEMNE